MFSRSMSFSASRYSYYSTTLPPTPTLYNPTYVILLPESSNVYSYCVALIILSKINLLQLVIEIRTEKDLWMYLKIRNYCTPREKCINNHDMVFTTEYSTLLEFRRKNNTDKLRCNTWFPNVKLPFHYFIVWAIFSAKFCEKFIVLGVHALLGQCSPRPYCGMVGTDTLCVRLKVKAAESVYPPAVRSKNILLGVIARVTGLY